MKKTLLITCIILIFQYAAAQKEDRFPLSDAIEFQNAGMKGKILKAYYDDINVFNGNHFIDLNGIDKATVDAGGKAQIFDAQNGTSSSGIGSSIINGLGIVVANRFKEELTIAFLNNFREKLKSDKYYLGKVFPKTKLVLLNDNPFNHKVWLASFRGALDEDIKLLPDNLPQLLASINGELEKNEDTKLRLTDNEKLILQALIIAYKPAVTIARDPSKTYIAITGLLENAKNTDLKDVNIQASLAFLHLLTKELGNKHYTDWGLQPVLLRLKDPEVAKTFIGLVIEKYDTELKNLSVENENETTKAKKKTNMYEYLRSIPTNNLQGYSDLIKGIIEQITQINNAINDLKTLKDTKNHLDPEDYSTLINEGIETIAFFTSNSTILVIKPNANVPKEFKYIYTYATTAKELALTINTYIASKEYAKVLAASLSLIVQYIPQDKLDKSTDLKDFVKYTDLAVNMASAKTADEMADALEGAALPTQSYRLKRNSYFTVTLNAYAGGFIGREKLTNSEAKNETAWITGFTAPIGVGFNWGLSTGQNPSKYSKYPTKTLLDENGDVIKETGYFKGHSISIFTSIIDVGAITAFRLTDDETPSNNVNWGNVFAPGAYLIWGIGNTPLALAAGAQYGPQLRKVTAIDGAAVATIDSRAWRFGLSLTVDIPLFSLYAKTEKVEKKKKQTQ